MFAGIEDDLHVTLHADLAQLFVPQGLIFSLQLLKICTEKVKYGAWSSRNAKVCVCGSGGGEQGSQFSIFQGGTFPPFLTF